MGFHPESQRMILLATQPGVTVDQVCENTGFEMLVAEEVEASPAPTAEELRILRDEVESGPVIYLALAELTPAVNKAYNVARQNPT